MSSLYTQQAFGFGEDTLQYLQRCLRRTGSDVTYVTCDCPLLAAALDVSRLTRTVRRRHVIAADPLVTGSFRRGLQITAAMRVQVLANVHAQGVFRMVNLFALPRCQSGFDG
jgi:hypothetical protein